MAKHDEEVHEPKASDLEVDKRPKDWAAGIPGVLHSMEPAVAAMGVTRTAKTVMKMNQKDGFDCPSCAWPDPHNRKAFEFCENGAKAVTWEATPIIIDSAFWVEHSVSDLRRRSEYWLGQQGRLTEPVYKPVGEDHYRPVSWKEAVDILSTELNALDFPDQASFYTSGRTSNEAAFAYQLFARGFGTNNLPDCSNMCHESSGWAMGESIGVGKATVNFEDYENADLIIIMGQNPGTNHPRMLTELENCKRNGGKIVAINPLPEAGLRRYKNPQKVRGIVGRGTDLADQFLQIRLSGDMALMQAVSKRVLDAETARPGTVLDHDFLDRYCQGLDELREHLSHLREETVLEATGLTSAEIDELADRYMSADKVIITWAMGITQQKKGVDAIKEIMNLLLLRGNIGKAGAGASPIRGHSNVQGDRTMGIWEQMPDSFLNGLEKEFGFNPPREHGVDSVQMFEAMQQGKIKVFMALGGNLVSAVSDTGVAHAAMEGTDLTVQVSTKLNRSHTVTGAAALILPTMGRTEIDIQESGEQFVTVEDTVCAVHPSWGNVEPVSHHLLSETAIVSRIAHAVLGDTINADWVGFEKNYDLIREHISRVVAGCENYNQRVRREGGFILAHGPRDTRTFPTPTGKAMLTVNELEYVERPAGTLILQTLRSHDQFNTTIYSHDDRYRGIRKGRDVVFVNATDLAELGLRDGDYADVHGVHDDGVARVMRQCRLVEYPTSPGCVAAYYPEANVLVPLSLVAEASNTPVSKAVLVRLEKVQAPVPANA